MNRERLNQIENQAKAAAKRAERILNGDSEYDGADGAREVRDLCAIINELVAEVERCMFTPSKIV